MLNIFKIFSNNDKSSISFFELYKKIVKWRESKVYPFAYNLPSVISFPSYFWSDVIGIYKETLKDGLERAISVFWADGELILTSVVKGNESSVSSNHQLNVRYAVHPTKKKYFRKEVILNGKVLKRKDIYYKKAPKKVSVEYLFNMHTHPSHLNERQERSYSFFSLKDIQSLISSQAILTGLVTDKLWLLIRTSDTPSSFDMLEKDITVESLKSKLGIAVYVADFNQKAIKQ